MPKVAAVREATEKADRRGKTYDLGERLLVGIDPGDVHVGFAVFCKEHDGHPVCSYTMELTPDECADRVAGMLARGELAVIAIERFSLYEDKALSQVGSEMATSQLIGVINYLARVHNQFVRGVERSAAKDWAEVVLVSEGAHAKKAIRSQLRARGIDRVGKVGSHTGDAEEQGWYWLYRLEEGTG